MKSRVVYFVGPEEGSLASLQKVGELPELVPMYLDAEKAARACEVVSKYQKQEMVVWSAIVSKGLQP